MNDKTMIKGKVTAVLYDSEGNVKKVIEDHNTITELHDALVADRMAGGADTLISYGHAGTGSGQTSADTNLDTHCDEARTALTSSTQGAGAADNDVVYVFTLGAGICTATITELGLFVAAAQATADMMCYTDSVNFTKAAGDSLVVTWTVQYGSS